MHKASHYCKDCLLYFPLDGRPASTDRCPGCGGRSKAVCAQIECQIMRKRVKRIYSTHYFCIPCQTESTTPECPTCGRVLGVPVDPESAS